MNKRELSNGLIYSVSPGIAAHETNVFLYRPAGGFNLGFKFKDDEKVIKTKKQLILYTYDINKNKTTQMSQDEFINRFFGEFTLDGKQFLDYLKTALLQNYHKTGKHTESTIIIIKPSSISPAIIAGVGLGISQASLLLESNFAKRVKVKKINFLGMPKYINVGKEKTISYILSNDICHLSVWWPSTVDNLLDNWKINFYKTDKVNIQINKATFYKYLKLTDEQKKNLDAYIEPYKQKAEEGLKLIKANYNEQVKIVDNFIAKDGTVPANYEYANQSEKSLIKKLNDLQNQNVNYSREYIHPYLEICYFLREKFINKRPISYPDKNLLDIFRKQSANKKTTTNAKSKTKEQLVAIIDKAIPKLMDQYLNKLKFENYVIAKYGKVDINKINDTQVNAIKSDIKTELDKLVVNVTNAINKKIGQALDENIIKDKIDAYAKSVLS